MSLDLVSVVAKRNAAMVDGKTRLQESAARLRALLTTTTGEDSPDPVEAYELRGVGIVTAHQSNITYMMYPPPTPDTPEGTESSSSWWRISYDTAGDKALVAKEVSYVELATSAYS